MSLRLLTLIFACALRLGAQANAPHPVVLISIDGLKPEYVLQADAHGLKIPNLRALLARGAHATGVVGVIPTVTYPSHTTLVTGASPARHGIISNNPFDPFNRNQDGWFWYAHDIRVPTLWDAVMDAHRTVGSVHWPVTVDARITWNIPQYWRSGEPDDRKLIRALSTPGLYDALEREVGVPYADGIDESITGDELRARFVERMIESRRPALMLAYFTALDHEQHGNGPFTPTVLATLERIDAIVGAVIASADRAYKGREVVALVSDHGFARTTRALNLISAFRSANLIDYATAEYDKPTGWRAAIWGGGASAAIVLKDTADVATRTRVEQLLRTLAADSVNGIARILDAAELRRRGGFPGASFLVDLRDGYTFGWNPRGAVMEEVSAGGMHGYLPDHPAMRATFIIAGPGIPRGRDLGLVDQRAIAPTLARVLGVKLPTAEVPALLP